MGLKRVFLLLLKVLKDAETIKLINYTIFLKNNIKCIKTREPGGTKISEKIRKVIIEDLKNK